MGLGMVAVCPEANLAKILDQVPDAAVIGRVTARANGEQVVFKS